MPQNDPGSIRADSTLEPITASVFSGGSRIGNRGYFFPLTVPVDVPDDARAMNEGPFGPLALVNPVRNLDEAIEKANALPFGLAAYAFTRSAGNVDRLANDVEAGNLSINHFVASVAETPFGGAKDSGYGTEGLACYTVAKNVSHKTM
jgi:succinate-semialdehyde dehydrogenase/glutarate-semialdehyde dehydrogenase